MNRSLKVFFYSLAGGTFLSVLFWKTAVFDDAYITFRYARNIARGLGPVFNAGERVEGCTAFLQMIFLAPFAALGANLAYVTVVVSLLAWVGISVMGHRKIAASDASEYNAAWSWLFPVFVMTSPALMHWTISAMETVWFTAVLTAAILVTEKEMDRSRLPIASALLCLLAALIRPEGNVLAFSLALSWVLFASSGKYKNAIVFSAIFGVLYGAYFLWRFSYFGHLFPNTYYAKVGSLNFFLVGRGLFYLIKSCLGLIIPLVLVVLLVVAYLRKVKLERWEKVSLVVILFLAMQMVTAGGDFMPYHRFLLPVWPIALLFVWNLIPRIRRADARPLRRLPAFFVRPHFRVLKLVALALAVNGATTLLSLNEAKVLAGAGLTRQMEKVARTLDPILPPDALVASTAIGAVGYILDRPLIDMLGLTDETIAHTPIVTGPGVAGHEKHNEAYLLSRKPDVILACVEFSKKPLKACPREKFKHALSAFTALADEREFRRNYNFYSHKTKKKYISTYVRRDLIDTPEWEGWFVPWKKDVRKK